MNKPKRNQNFSYKNIVRTAAELCHADFAYLVLRKDNRNFDVSAHYGMDGIDLKLISGLQLSASSNEASIFIPHAYRDSRLKGNKIVGVTTAVVLKVTAVNVLFQSTGDFKIEQYNEYICGEFGSLVVLDKEVAIRTEHQIKQLESLAELIARQLMLERKLIDMKQKTIEEVSHDLVNKTERMNSILNNMSQGIMIKNKMGELIECNPAAKEILGSLTKDFGTVAMRAINKDGTPFKHENDPFHMAAHSGKACLSTLMGFHQNDQLVWISVSAIPMMEKGKATQNILITILDVTELHSITLHTTEASDISSSGFGIQKLKGGDNASDISTPEETEEIDEVANETDLLFAMLNAIPTDGGVPDLQYVQLPATKSGFTGSNAMLLGSSGNLMEDFTESVYTGKILVAEDCASDQKIIGKMLDKFQCIYKMVNNGADALKAAKTGEFNLILMDCSLPGMDGYDASSAIKSLGQGVLGSLKIIAMASNDLEGDEETCLRSGMDEVMMKPLKMGLLEDNLRRWQFDV